MITTVVLLLLFSLLLIGAPIGLVLIISGAVGIYWIAGPEVVLGLLSTTPRESAAVFEFLTIPMFLLMAEFVLRSGIADDLFEAAAAWFGRVRGGLGIATALAGAGFGAICGSSTAAAATLSSTSLPAMIKHGYHRPVAAGVVAISGTLAMLIPPSVAMVVYAFLADVSVARMLIAGVLPGILVTLTIALTVYGIARWDPRSAPISPPKSLGERLYLLRNVGPMLVLLMAVTGVIYTGVATPTEASALGALAAAILYFMRGRRSMRGVLEVFGRAARTSCMIGLILLGAHIFSTFFALSQVTPWLVSQIAASDLSPLVILLIIVAIYIMLGCFMDQMAILVLTVPVVAPLMSSLGYDLVWFGVVIIVVAELGLVTPPFGLNVFIVSKYSRTPVGEVFLGVTPHIIAHFIAIAAMLAFPAIVLWLPSQMN